MTAYMNSYASWPTYWTWTGSTTYMGFLYADYNIAGKALDCPSNRKQNWGAYMDARTPKPNGTNKRNLEWVNTNNRNLQSYGINFGTFGYVQDGNHADATDKRGAVKISHLSGFGTTGTAIWIADAASWKSVGDDTSQIADGGWLIEPYQVYPNFPGGANSWGYYPTYAIHAGKVNVAIIDGHVESLSPNVVTNRSNPEAKTRLWNPRYKDSNSAAPELFNF